MDENPFYQWLRERGGGWCFGTTVKMPTGDAVAFSWERAFELGPFRRATVQSLASLRPHLARAGFIAGRLELEQACTAMGTLARLNLPAGVINFSNGLIAANDQLQALVPDVLQDRAKRVTLTDRKADALLERTLLKLSRSVELEEVSPIPIAGTEKYPSSLLHIVPMRRAARDIFAASLCLLVLTPISLPNAPTAGIVQALLDLTPSEARTLVAIAEGQTLDQFARHARLPVSTARVQHEALLAKIGISRQADLAALLART